MKFAIIKFATVFCFIIFAALFLTIASCKKDKICYGNVKVTNASGTPISAAKVVLSAPSVGGTVTYDGVTDGSGEVNFEIKLPAIFDVEATSSTLPGKKGLGTLRCDEPGKKTSIAVKIY